MDIKQLRTLLAIAETGSLTRASELLHVVQPALSRQLKLLEDELGVQVFERNRRGMQLTDAGKTFVEKARRALRQLDQAKTDIIATKNNILGTVSIGMLPSLGDAISVPLVASLRRQYPDLLISLTTGFTSELQGLLEKGELDVALLGEYKPSALLSTEPVLREALYVVGLPATGLRLTDPVTLSSAAKLPLILPAYPQGLRLLIDHACTMMGVHLNVVAESNSTSVQLDLVRAGQGFAILPFVALTPYLEDGRLSAAPITAPDMHRNLAIAQLMAKRGSTSILCVVQALRTQLKILFGADRPGVVWSDDSAAQISADA